MRLQTEGEMLLANLGGRCQLTLQVICQEKTLSNIGLRDSEDSSIWHYAQRHEAVILTKDEDFPHRQGQNPHNAPVIVWLRPGNTSRRALLHWFGPLLPEIEALIEISERLIEVRQIAEPSSSPFLQT